jgi:hypothetical protein
MQVLGSIPGDEALAALEQLVHAEKASESIRQAAVEALRKRQAKAPNVSTTSPDLTPVR